VRARTYRRIDRLGTERGVGGAELEVAFAIQWLVGVAIEAYAPALGIAGAFDAVFGVLLALQVVGLTLLLMRLPAAPAAQSETGS
jgi:hypothetical protein